LIPDRLRHLAFVTLLLASVLAGGEGVASLSKANLVKATLVEKIARYIDWPQTPSGNFVLCVASDHPLLPAIKAYYDGVRILDLPVTVRQLRRSESISGCQAAVLWPSDSADVAKSRIQADREHILLLAEGEGVARWGVHVGYYIEASRLRLEVNRRAMEASGLKVSFRLLEVAKVVE
jgi:hypothetical protein